MVLGSGAHLGFLRRRSESNRKSQGTSGTPGSTSFSSGKVASSLITIVPAAATPALATDDARTRRGQPAAFWRACAGTPVGNLPRMQMHSHAAARVAGAAEALRALQMRSHMVIHEQGPAGTEPAAQKHFQKVSRVAAPAAALQAVDVAEFFGTLVA